MEYCPKGHLQIGLAAAAFSLFCYFRVDAVPVSPGPQALPPNWPPSWLQLHLPHGSQGSWSTHRADRVPPLVKPTQGFPSPRSKHLRITHSLIPHPLPPPPRNLRSPTRPSSATSTGSQPPGTRDHRPPGLCLGRPCHLTKRRWVSEDLARVPAFPEPSVVCVRWDPRNYGRWKFQPGSPGHLSPRPPGRLPITTDNLVPTGYLHTLPCPRQHIPMTWLAGES